MLHVMRRDALLCILECSFRRQRRAFEAPTSRTYHGNRCCSWVQNVAAKAQEDIHISRTPKTKFACRSPCVPAYDDCSYNTLLPQTLLIMLNLEFPGAVSGSQDHL